MSTIASSAQLRASFLRWALFLVPAISVLGYFSGVASNSGDANPWFAALMKPALYPPPITFGIVWPVLYLMIGLAAALVASAWGAKGRTIALLFFALQLAFNLAWSPVFFALHQLRGALIVIGVLDLLVVVTIILFWRIRWLAGALMLPYLAWICFATVLTWQIYQLNPQADGFDYSGAVQRIEL